MWICRLETTIWLCYILTVLCIHITGSAVARHCVMRLKWLMYGTVDYVCKTTLPLPQYQIGWKSIHRGFGANEWNKMFCELPYLFIFWHSPAGQTPWQILTVYGLNRNNKDNWNSYPTQNCQNLTPNWLTKWHGKQQKHEWWYYLSRTETGVRCGAQVMSPFIFLAVFTTSLFTSTLLCA